MELTDLIRSELQDACDERIKSTIFRSLTLIYADALECLNPHDYCRDVGVDDSWHVEFSEMIAVYQKIQHYGFQIKLRDRNH